MLKSSGTEFPRSSYGHWMSDEFKDFNDTSRWFKRPRLKKLNTKHYRSYNIMLGREAYANNSSHQWPWKVRGLSQQSLNSSTAPTRSTIDCLASSKWGRQYGLESDLNMPSSRETGLHLRYIVFFYYVYFFFFLSVLFFVVSAVCLAEPHCAYSVSYCQSLTENQRTARNW